MQTEIDTEEALRRRIRSEQASKNFLRRERDFYKQKCNDLTIQNKALQEKIDDEVNREWSPVWVHDKLITVQEENEQLKKYIMALEEKRNFKGVIF